MPQGPGKAIPNPFGTGTVRPDPFAQSGPGKVTYGYTTSPIPAVESQSQASAAPVVPTPTPVTPKKPTVSAAIAPPPSVPTAPVASPSTAAAPISNTGANVTPPSIAGLQSAAGGGGEVADSGAGTQELTGPSGLKQGLGMRIPPSLAALLQAGGY